MLVQNQKNDQSGRPVSSSVPGKSTTTAVRPPRRPTPPFDGIRSDLLDILKDGAEGVKALGVAMTCQATHTLTPVSIHAPA